MTTTKRSRQLQHEYVVEITNTMHRYAPLLYSIYLLLHVSAVVCHNQGASGSEIRENKDRFGGVSYNVVTWLVCRIVVGPSVVLPS
jgi:hypothetical protein